MSNVDYEMDSGGPVKDFNFTGPLIFVGVATGATIEEVEAEIRGAIVFNVEGLRQDGVPIPDGASQVEYIEIAAQRSATFRVLAGRPTSRMTPSLHRANVIRAAASRPADVQRGEIERARRRL